MQTCGRADRSTCRHYIITLCREVGQCAGMSPHIQVGMQTCRHADMPTLIHADRSTCRQIDLQKGVLEDTQTGRHANRLNIIENNDFILTIQGHRQVGMQTDYHANKCTCRHAYRSPCRRMDV